MWSCKPMCHCKLYLILESYVKFDETYTKISKYENSLFSYSLHSTVNLPEWRLKDTNVLQYLFSVCLLRQLLPKEKTFLQNYTRNIAKIDEIREELWRNHQNRNFSFRNFLLRWYEQSIKNKELQDEEQKIYTNFFYFYILEELSHNIFHKFFKKENS